VSTTKSYVRFLFIRAGGLNACIEGFPRQYLSVSTTKSYVSFFIYTCRGFERMYRGFIPAIFICVYN